MMTDVLSSYFMQDAHVAHKKKHIKNLVQVWALFLEEERMLQKKTTSSLAAVVHLSFSMEFF